MAAVSQLLAVTSLMVTFTFAQSQDGCKNPPVVSRLLADDARAASPFYVLALPRTAKTAQIDNVCYTYYDGPKKGSPFLHVMSITNNDGSNEIHAFTKGDISDRKGLALATGLDGSCAFHDYTLKPICGSTVFILYRCFIRGECVGVDAGRSPGVDVRVALAASPAVDAACLAELRSALADTSALAGADYAFLPQRRAPKCVTRYNGTESIGAGRAAGALSQDPTDRFGSDVAVEKTKKPTTQPSAWKNSAVQNGVKPATVAASGGYGQTTNGYTYQPYPSTNSQQGQQQATQGQSPATTWSAAHGGGGGWGSWGWHAPHPSQTQTHYSQQANVVYHVHRWDTPPPGCCRCN